MIAVLIEPVGGFRICLDHDPPEAGMVARSNDDAGWFCFRRSGLTFGDQADQNGADQDSAGRKCPRCPGAAHSKLAINASMSDWSIAWAGKLGTIQQIRIRGDTIRDRAW